MMTDMNRKIARAAIGNRVRRRRLLLGVTLEELAAATSREGGRLGPQSIFKVEMGERSFDFVEAAAIAEALDCPVADFLPKPGEEHLMPLPQSTFNSWLKLQCGREDAIGDLARDAVVDRRLRGVRTTPQHLIDFGAPEHVVRAAAREWLNNAPRT